MKNLITGCNRDYTWLMIGWVLLLRYLPQREPVGL